MDLRSKITKEIIKNSLFELLKRKPLRKITVTEICEKSEINRTTFYKYYLDVFDLMEKIEEEYFQGLEDYISAHDKIDDEALIYILKNIRKDRESFLAVASDHGDRSYIKKLLRKWYETNPDTVNLVLGDIDENKRSWVFDFITQGDTAIILNWIEGGMRETEEEVAKLILDLNERVIDG